jgi:hypothetical protein
MQLELEWEEAFVPTASIKEQGHYRCAAWSPEAEFYGEPPADSAAIELTRHNGGSDIKRGARAGNPGAVVGGVTARKGKG